MALDDPSTWAQGLAAAKTAFDSVRSAISIVRDPRTQLGQLGGKLIELDFRLTARCAAASVEAW